MEYFGVWMKQINFKVSMRYLCVNVKTISKVAMNFFGVYMKEFQGRDDLIFFFSFAGALQRSNFYVNCRTIALNPKKCSMCLSLNNLAPCGKALKGVSYKWESFNSCENLNIDPGLVETCPREKSLNKFH
jgi:hypothetical protein